MVYEARKQLIAWMEADYHSKHNYAFLMKNNMAAGAFGHARNNNYSYN